MSRDCDCPLLKYRFPIANRQPPCFHSLRRNASKTLVRPSASSTKFKEYLLYCQHYSVFPPHFPCPLMVSVGQVSSSRTHTSMKGEDPRPQHPSPHHRRTRRHRRDGESARCVTPPTAASNPPLSNY